MTFANFASEVKLCETFHISVDFAPKVLRRGRAQAEFTYGQDMLTLINEQFQPEFIRILGTFASRANDN